MARWSREEIEEALDTFQAAALKGGKTGNWRDWANCFTEDATYVEHHYGKFWGRERIFDWITETMSCMRDLGDGKIYEEPNRTILHYAGNGLFKSTKRTPTTRPTWA